MRAALKSIVTLRDGRTDGWHVLHQNDEPLLARKGLPWAVCRFRRGLLKEVAGRYAEADEAQEQAERWHSHSEDYSQDYPVDALDTALDPHGPWGAP